MEEDMFIIGLTGTIASGKSTAARMLREEGLAVVDADAIAREAVEPGTEGLQAVVSLLGEDYLTPDGRMDRKKVGALVFSDPAEMERYNAVVRPAIKKAIQKKLAALRAQPAGEAVLDAPLLLEYGMEGCVDEVWVITARDDVRIARMKARDGLDEAAAKERIAAQLSDAEKIAKASRVIDNSQSMEALRAAVCAALAAARSGRKPERD